MNTVSWNPIGFLERSFKFNTQKWKSEISNLESIKLPGIHLKRLDWDSTFFEADIFKILYLGENANSNDAYKLFAEKKKPKKRTQYFLEIPSEATNHFGLLTRWGFSLIETRLTYYHLLEEIPLTNQLSRNALENDIIKLKKVASSAINLFDRYHVDSFFPKSDTDKYLEVYIENCIKGFAEKVFVPDLTTDPASFVAISRLKEPEWLEEGPLFRIPLTACLPENKGWHYPLCIAALNYAKANKSKCLVMTTQSTNKAVIHNCEKMGFKLGSSFHIFSKSFL